jgi:multiple sugar transport system permease protein
MTAQPESIDRSFVPGIEEPGKVLTSDRRMGRWTPGKLLFLLGLVVATVLFLVPFLWLLSASLKTRADVFGSEWIPDPVQLSNYSRVFEVAPVASWFMNSVVVALLAAIAVTVSSAMVAFGFAYFRFPYRNALFGLVLATMMLPGAVTMVPTYLIWDHLGMTDTLTPLWAGNLFGSAFYIFLLRQFFLGLPRELFEAARVDGANYLQMWWRVALPLTKPALIVVFIFEFKASWTDLVKPLIYLRDVGLYTLPRGLKALLDTFGVTTGGEGEIQWIMAGTVVATVPMIVIFFLAQRYFLEGVATTGVKG